MAAAVAAAGRQKNATDVAKNEAQAQANVTDEATQPPQDYVYDGKNTSTKKSLQPSFSCLNIFNVSL